MIDLQVSLILLAVTAAAGVAYGVRLTRVGAAHDARVERAGTSVLLGKGAMEATYWSLQPIARGAVALGLTANAITLISLGLGLLGALAIAFGHFGVGAALTVISALGDALDGIVARRTGTASDAGEVFDAAVDRYEEFFFLAALAYYFREVPVALVLALLSVLGSFMVSYGTAKAEALQVEPPRGAMRRAERAVYLTTGVMLAPVAAAVAARFGLPAWVGWTPILFSLGLVGVVANVSGARRLAAVARSVAGRGVKPVPPTLTTEPEVHHEAFRSAAP